MRLAFVIAVSLVLWASPADACSCMSGGTTCSGIATADAVFEATVESLEMVTLPSPPVTSGPSVFLQTGPMRAAKLKDVKDWRGESQDTVFTDLSEEMCGYTFTAGSRYLILAHRDAAGRLSVSRCGETRPIEDDDGVLEYLKSLQGPSSQTHVWGRVLAITGWKGFAEDTAPVAGARVTLNGRRRMTTTTDERGAFAVAGLPYGSYTVAVRMPSSMSSAGSIERSGFELNASVPHACAELALVTTPSGRITGVVLDDRGAPLDNVFVQLGITDQRDLSLGSAGAGFTTDSRGRYEFTEMPPGHYTVGVNVGDEPSYRAPFTESLARTTSGKTTIDLAAGQSIRLAPIRVRILDVPPPWRISSAVTVTGTVRNAKGVAVAGVEITATGLQPDRPPHELLRRATADAKGRFQLRLWKDERYRIVIGSELGPSADVEFVATGQHLTIVLASRQ